MNTDAWGGSEELWFRTAKYVAKSGLDVSCLLYEWKNTEKEIRVNDFKIAGCKVLLIPNKGRQKENIWQRLRFEWITRLEQQWYLKNFNVENFDHVVINQGGFMDVCMNPWKKFYKRLKSYTLTFHNYNPQFIFKEKKKRILINWIRHAKTNEFAAAEFARVIGEQLNYSIPNKHVLVNPITISIKEKITPYPELEQGCYKFIMLASLDLDRKAQDNLIKAFADPVWNNRNYSLELYGEGRGRPVLEKLIQELGLQRKVFLKGKTQKVAEVLERAHILLQITHTDAIPISVLEAMCMSRPVIVSAAGDMPLWIENGKNGWIAPDASVLNIKTILEKAWKYRDNWEKIGIEAFWVFNNKYQGNAEQRFLESITI